MKCKKCGSENVSVQVVSTVKTKKHGCMYWLLIGWWLELSLFFCFTLIYLVVKIFKPNNVVTRHKKEAICQSCGHSWRV